jgi:hypothetical protein
VSKNRELREQDIVNLLGRWKDRKYPYPSAMQEKRRAAFLASAAALLIGGLKAGLAAKSLSASAHGSAAPMTAGMKITLGILSTAIIGVSSYVGVILYNERDTLIDLLRGEPTATLSIAAPTSASGGATAASTPSLTATPTPTTSATALSEATPTQNNYQPVASSTPLPPATLTKPVATSTKPGLHVGQTKTPKPTKTPKR